MEVCLEILGERDPLKAAPGTIRALYGIDPVRNCVHAASNREDAVFVSIYNLLQYVFYFK